MSPHNPIPTTPILTSSAESQPCEVALVNPRAGSGAASRSSGKWKALLTANHQIRCGHSPEETERLAAEAARAQVARLTIIGGDGTIHHALNGYLSVAKTSTQVAVIPAGTANDYAASLRRHAELTGDRKITVDVATMQYAEFQRCFFNVAGIGLTAHAALASRPSPWLPARLRYTLGLMRTLINGWRYADVSIEFPERTIHQPQLLTLSVAVGQREGSFPLAPHAKLDDGQFNLLLASQLKRRDLCRYLPGLFVGKLPQNDTRIQYCTVTRIQLRSRTALPLHLDGEIYGSGTLPSDCDIRISHSRQIQLELLD